MADRSVNVKLKMDVAEYMSGARSASAATRAIEKAARDLRKAHDDEANAAGRVRVAEAKLNEIRGNSKATASQLAAAEEEVSRAHRQLAVAHDNTTAATKRFTEAQKAAGDESERSGRKVEDSMGRMAKRSNAQFDALKFTALSVGLPAAAAVGAAGVAAALAGTPLLFVALGAALLKNNQVVHDSFTSLRDHVVADSTKMAGVLEGPLAGSALALGASFDRMKPQIQAAFEGSAPAVGILTGAVTDFAENAMPGMVTAVQASGPALQGLRSLAGQTGSGMSEMFANMSRGSKDAGEGLTILGGATRDALGFIGNLTANLAGATGPLNSLRAGLQQAEQAMLTLTSSGGAAMGFLSGFTSAGTGALTALNGVVSVLNGLPTGLANFGGSLAAAGMIASRFGIDAGKGFEGLSSRIKEADGLGAKLGTTVGGLVAGALNPAALAVVGLGVLLGELGRRQEEAAKQAAAHASAVDSLTAALKRDAGAVGDSVRETVAKALADKNAGNNARALGVDMGTVTDAALGNKGAMGELLGASNSMINAWVRSGAVTKEQGAALQGNVQWLSENGGAASSLANDYGNLTEAQRNQLRATENLAGAAGESAKSLGEATTKTNDMAQASKTAAADAKKLAEAIVAVSNAARNAVGDNLSYRDAVAQLGEAQKNSTEVLKKHKPTSKEYTEARRQEEHAILAVLDARQKEATDTATGTAGEKDLAGIKARNVELQKMAATYKGELPQAMREMISSLDISSAAAAGFKVEVNDLGQAFVRLPNGKLIEIKGDATDATAKVKKFVSETDALNAQVTVGADIDPATGQVVNWKNTTSVTVGNTTTYTNIDPATGQVRTWKVTTDATGAKTTTYSTIDPATGQVQTWVRNTNGMWARTNVDANLGPAQSAVANWQPPNKSITVTAHLVYNNATGYIGSTTLGAHARGGLVGFAAGGEVTPRFAAGGVDIRRGGMLRGPGTGTSDSILMNTSRGLARGSNREFVVNARDTGRNLNALKYANAGGRIAPALTGPTGVVQSAISSGNVVQGAPRSTSSVASGSGDVGDVQVQVFVGDREITDIVDTQVRRNNRNVRRSTRTRAGGAK